ncbi:MULTISPECIES: ABC transporter permease [Microbacterium]|uniref:ABC transporter permease n=1 Tax=Microbacterium TaxID=33882 RepID=UPI00188801B7|nr:MULTISPECIES: ABC transporter permease [Microbacterium]
MTAPFDPTAERQRRFARLAALPMRPVGSLADGGVIRPVAEIFRHREMLDLLIRRDLKSRFKDSSLGFLWTLIRPLTQLAIYYVVMGQFLGAARGIDDFAIYVFAGLTIYGLLSEIVLGGVASVVANAGLVKKIYVPREVFPLAAMGAALFTFAIQLLVLLGATALAGSFPWSAEILYAIPSILLVVVYGAAFALLLSAVNVYLRDTQYLTEVVMMLLMWASPIVYTWTMAGDILGGGLVFDVYTANPITLAVLGFQRAFWVAGAPSDYPPDLLLWMGIALVIGLVLLYSFHRVFRRLQGNFAQAI